METLKIMAKKPDELRPLMTRMPEKLRARLAREAKRNDRSLNAEINYRLQSSLVHENAFGSKSMRDIAIAMAAAFNTAGAAAAYTSDAGADWIDDPRCYRAASFGVLLALMLRNGEAALDDEDLMNQCDSLKGAVATHIINARGSRK